MITLSNYQLTERLYEGADTLVYRAVQADGRRVVLKILKEPYPSPERIALFRREYDLMRRLGLRGVVEVYGLLEQERWVMVLEDFGGASLARLGLAGKLKVADFLSLAINITDILAQVHAKHIMHKNINPANIVLNSQTGQLKLTNLATSSVLSGEEQPLVELAPRLLPFDRLRASQAVPELVEGQGIAGSGHRGTAKDLRPQLGYMSPEQTGRLGRAMDYRTDFYSLGVTFYELLTGELPFQSQELSELVHSHIAKTPLAPHERRADLPRPLSEIVLKLMAKNPAERYQSAYGLKADLEHCWQEWQSRGDIAPFALAAQDRSGRLNLPQRLYGREAEIAQLLAAFERVHRSGQPELLLVAGYSGIGKSALVQEVYDPVTQKQGHFIDGKFDQFQRHIPYYALIQAFQTFVNQLLTESQAVLAEWKAKMLQALGSLGQVLTDAIPALELIIEVQPEVPTLGGVEAQHRFAYLFRSFVHAISQAEHPLVIFIDDLQWADGASLKMLQMLINSASNQHLLVIGAYRDNEVSASHPLMRSVSAIQEEQAVVQTITLQNLSLSHVTGFLSDALATPPTRVQPLAALLHEKTRGNPFFMSQFLMSLHQEGHLRFDFIASRETCAWQWDLAQIEQLNITDNVLQFVSHKVQKLPPATQKVLCLAACIGNRFALETLALIYGKSHADTACDLWAAVRDGIVSRPPLAALSANSALTSEPEARIRASWGDVAERRSKHEYKFVHDRLQQAVYLLMSEEERQQVHLRIGQLLLQTMPVARLPHSKQLFDVVNQLNLGRPRLTSDSDGPLSAVRLAELNLMAGQKAKQSAAYKPALAYFQIGIELLSEPSLAKSWSQHHALALELYNYGAEAAYLSGAFEEMAAHIAVVWQYAARELDKVHVYQLQIKAYVAQKKLVAALKSGLEILKQLDISLPAKPTQAHIVSGLLRIKWLLRGKPMQSLLDQPMTKDARILAAAEILPSLTQPAYLAIPKLFPLIVFKMVELSVKHGNFQASPFAYVNYGAIFGGAIGDIEGGYRFGKFALRLMDKLSAHRFKTKVHFIFNGMIKPWNVHPQETLAPLLEASQAGLETGDIEFAALALNQHAMHAFYTGQQLPVLLNTMIKPHLEQVRQLKQGAALTYLQSWAQIVINLQKEVAYNPGLSGEYFDEEQALHDFQKVGDRVGYGCTHLLQGYLNYHFYAYQKAVTCFDVTEGYLNDMIGLIYVGSFAFYDSLARLACYADAEAKERLRTRWRVASNQKKLKKWAKHAPMSYQHKYDLVEAERHRVLGDIEKARTFYEQAIDLAQRHEYPNEVALASELLGRFYLSLKNRELAALYMQKAHYSYQLWGATAKIKHLETQYPQLMGLEHAPTRRLAHISPTTTATDSISSTLDLASVIKASQTISGEIVLEKLLQKMMGIIIENAGAERGVLLLQADNQWLIQGLVTKDDVQVLQGLALSAAQAQQPPYLLSSAIVNYVARTQESVVLHEARRQRLFKQAAKFTNDPYILSQQPQSILCMPLINQTQVSGIIYLENNLSSSVFTPQRLEILRLLSSQMAVSLDNARLYDNLQRYREHLEELVDERTVELTRANAQLEQEIIQRTEIEAELVKAKEAAEAANQAKSDFLSNMSHELRTPLNGILGYAQILKRSQHLAKKDKKGLDIIHQSGNYLLTLINDILDLSKIEARKMELYPQELYLAGFLSSVVSMMRIRAEEKDILFVYEADEALPAKVQADEKRLRQVLINLLGNAVKFTERGRVTLHVGVVGEAAPHADPVTLRFEIIDSGVGMTPEQQKKIFLPFEQVGEAKQRAKGTGLGLAITRRLVNLMGGEVHVESQLGVGSRFWFDLALPVVGPDLLAQQKEKNQHDTLACRTDTLACRIDTLACRTDTLACRTDTLACRINGPIMGYQGAKRTILVVDDGEVNRLVLSNMLQPLGFEMIEGENGQQEVDLARQIRPDLILTDLMMPVMNGFEAVKQIRQIPEIAHTPIIAISASVFDMDQKKSRLAGCDAFLPKPVDEQNLLSLISQQLRLEWIYGVIEGAEAGEENTDHPTDVSRLVVPPAAELEILYELASLGKISAIRKWLNQIEQLDRHYAPFANQVRELAGAFEDEKILALVEQHLQR